VELTFENVFWSLPVCILRAAAASAAARPEFVVAAAGTSH